MTIAELLVKIGIDDSDMKRGEKSFDSSMSSMGKKLAGLAAGFVSFQKIAAGIEFNKMKQNAEIAFTTMLGSAEKAKDLLTDLRDLGMKTPLEFKDIRQAGQTLLQFQIAAKDVTKTVRMLGDVSLGDSQKLQALATAFGQVSSAGKLSGQDLLQFINAGFNPLNEIAKETGETMAELRDRMSKGAIGAEEVRGAFEKATSAGGAFYNALGNLADSLTGAESNFKDMADTMLGKLTEGAVGPLTNAYKKLGDSMLNIINGPAKDFGASLGGAITVVSDALTGIINFVAKLPGGFTAAAASAAALGALFGPWGAALGVVLSLVGSIVSETKQAREEYDSFQKVLKEGVKSGTDLEKALAGVNAEIANYEKFGATRAEIERLKQVRAELVEAEKSRALNARGAKEIAAAAEKEAVAVKTTSEASKQYVDARKLVVDTLEKEKTELQEIQEKIALLERSPWASGELENQRLAAIRALRGEMAGLSEWDKYQSQLRRENAEREADDIIQKRNEQYEEEIKGDEDKEKKKREQFEATMGSIGDSMLRLASSAGAEAIRTTIDQVANGEDAFIALSNGLSVFWDQILAALPDLLLNAGLAAVQGGQFGLGAALIAASGLVELGNATGFFEEAGGAIGGFLSDVGSAIGGFFGFASGTDFAPGGMAVVGEQGPEIVNLPRGSQVMNNSETSAAMRSGIGGGVTVNINSPMQLDVIEASRVMKKSMRELAFQGAL